MLFRSFRGFYYERMAAISRFIVQAIPALNDERNNMSIEQLCGLFQSDLFSPETITSYADENSNGAKYFCELLEMEDINSRLDRIVVVLTTGEYHKERLKTNNACASSLLVIANPSIFSWPQILH